MSLLFRVWLRKVWNKGKPPPGGPRPGCSTSKPAFVPPDVSQCSAARTSGRLLGGAHTITIRHATPATPRLLGWPPRESVGDILFLRCVGPLDAVHTPPGRRRSLWPTTREKSHGMVLGAWGAQHGYSNVCHSLPRSGRVVVRVSVSVSSDADADSGDLPSLSAGEGERGEARDPATRSSHLQLPRSRPEARARVTPFATGVLRSLILSGGLHYRCMHDGSPDSRPRKIRIPFPFFLFPFSSFHSLFFSLRLAFAGAVHSHSYH